MNAPEPPLLNADAPARGADLAVIEAKGGDGLASAEGSGLARVPSPFASAEGRMILLFDVLWLLGAVPVYGLPCLAAGGIAAGGWGAFGLFGLAATLPLAYFAFLLVLVLILGAIHRVLPREEPGTSRVFVDRAFFNFLLHWGLEHYLPRPFLTHVHLLTVLRTLHYRLQGARIGWSTHLSPGAQVWSPALLEFGHLCYVGEFAHVTAHLSLGDKLLLGPVRLGDRTNLGAHVHVGPSCTIGNDVRIGALCDIAPGVEIEDGVEIGPRCVLAMGARIGAGAVLEPRTFIDVCGTVPAGELWGGDPAHKLGDAPKRRRRRAGFAAG